MLADIPFKSYILSSELYPLFFSTPPLKCETLKVKMLTAPRINPLFLYLQIFDLCSSFFFFFKVSFLHFSLANSYSSIQFQFKIFLLCSPPSHNSIFFFSLLCFPGMLHIYKLISYPSIL